MSNTIVNFEFKSKEDFVKKYAEYQKEIERLNNDIKELLKENSNKEKVIIAQDNIIREVREHIEKSKSKLPLGINDFTCEMVYSDEVVLANELLKILDKEK